MQLVGSSKGKPIEESQKFKEIGSQYQQKLENNPYTTKAKKERWELANQFGNASKVRFENEWKKESEQYVEKAKQEKLQSEKEARRQYSQNRDMMFLLV